MVLTTPLLVFVNPHNDTISCNFARLSTPSELSLSVDQPFTVIAQQAVEGGTPLTYSGKPASLELLTSSTSYDSLTAVSTSLAKLRTSSITVDDNGFATFSNVFVKRDV